MSMTNENYRLRVRGLDIGFKNNSKVTNVVKGVSFDLFPGEILSLVGESGCGKSASCLALGRLLASNAVVSAKEISFRDPNGRLHDLFGMSSRALRKVRGAGIAYIFQEPSASLNPVFRVGDQIAEVLKLHRPDVTDLRKECVHLLSLVGIPAPESRVDAFPHEMSGGMQQRVMIAMALAGNPRILIADEPTTALDVTIQSQILELIDRLRRERDMSVILVTHNLGIVSQLADRVAVMYAGRIVESGSTREVIDAPQHPYTAALLKAVPELGAECDRLPTIRGSVGSPENFPAGCRFCGRCDLAETLGEEAKALCSSKFPAPTAVSENHLYYCHHGKAK